MLRKIRMPFRISPGAAILLLIASPASGAEIEAPSEISTAYSTFRLEGLDPNTNSAAQAAAMASADQKDRAKDSAGPSVGPVDTSRSDAAATDDGHPDAASLNKQAEQRGWTKTLARMEIAFQALNVIDLAQTLECRSRPTCHEKNPILGRRPSKAALLGFTAATGLAHYALVRSISHDSTDGAKVMSFATVLPFAVVVGLNFKELY